MSVSKPFRGRGGRRAWKVRWHNADGTQGAKTVYSRAEADALDALHQRRWSGAPAALIGQKMTLAQWRELYWLPEHVAGKAKSTRRTYDGSWRRHLAAQLGPQRLSDLNVLLLRAWQRELLEAGVSADAVIKARTVLSGLLAHARDADVIPTNPVISVKPPIRPHTDEIVPLTIEEVERVRAQMDDPLDKARVSTMAYGGLRPGEMRALRSSHVREMTLLVRDAADLDGELKATKTGRVRSPRLEPVLREELAPLLDRAPARGVLLGHRDGRRWTENEWDAWRRDVWHPACEAAGIGHRRPYDLRHTRASTLLAEGATALEVAEQLGNSAEQVNRRYGHVLAEYQLLPAARRPVIDTEIRRARAQLETEVPNERPEQAA